MNLIDLIPPSIGKPVELARCITRPLLCKPTALSRHSVEVKSGYLCSHGEQQDLLIIHVPEGILLLLAHCTQEH